MKRNKQYTRYIIYINGYSMKGVYKFQTEAKALFKELKRICEPETHLVLYKAWLYSDNPLDCFCSIIDEYKKPRDIIKI